MSRPPLFLFAIFVKQSSCCVKTMQNLKWMIYKLWVPRLNQKLQFSKIFEFHKIDFWIELEILKEIAHYPISNHFEKFA